MIQCQDEYKQQLSSQRMNREELKSPNPKLARYLLRIEQLMSSKSRSTSPLSSRISKVRRINSLDHYLKHQRAFKIIVNYISKAKKQISRYFFNLLLSLLASKYDKNHKSVSFFQITPRKTKHTVNLSVPTKTLFNLIQIKLKQNLASTFALMKNSIKNNSYIDIMTSARSHPPKLTHQPKKFYNNPSNRNKMPIILLKLYLSRYHIGFTQIKIFSTKQQLNCVIEQLQQKDHKKVQYMTMLETMFIVNLINKIKYRKCRECLQSLKNNVLKENNLSAKKQMLKEKFVNFSLRTFNNNKNNALICFHTMRCFEESSKQQRLQAMTKYRNKSQRDLNNFKIYQASMIITKYQYKLETKSKILFFNKLSLNNKKLTLCYAIQKIVYTKITMHSSCGFQRIKSFNIINTKNQLQQSLKSVNRTKNNKQTINWNAISKLVNLDKFYISYLREPFDAIGRIKKKNPLQLSLKINEVAEEPSEYKSFCNESQLIAKNKNCQKQKQLLPKTLSKILMLRIAQAFINIQFNENEPPTQNHQFHRKSQWMKDVQNFLIDRDRFNKSFMGKFNKIEQIINENSNGGFTTPQSKKNISPRGNGPVITK